MPLAIKLEQVEEEIGIYSLLCLQSINSFHEAKRNKMYMHDGANDRKGKSKTLKREKKIRKNNIFFRFFKKINIIMKQEK